MKRRRRRRRKRQREEGPDASIEFVRFDIHLEIQFNFPVAILPASQRIESREGLKRRKQKRCRRWLRRRRRRNWKQWRQVGSQHSKPPAEAASLRVREEIKRTLAHRRALTASLPPFTLLFSPSFVRLRALPRWQKVYNAVWRRVGGGNCFPLGLTVRKLHLTYVVSLII